MAISATRLDLIKNKLVVGVALCWLIVNAATAQESPRIAQQVEESNLERQYLQLQAAIESEEAYSIKLAEEFFSYAQLLKQAGRDDESIASYTRASHIEKINDGLYSQRQRPSLLALFGLYLKRGDLDQSENYLRRILWIEKHDKSPDDHLTFDALLELGNYYLDLFLLNPRNNERSFSYLISANNLFELAVTKYGDAALDELLMPYGELALVNYYLTNIDIPNFDSVHYERSTGRVGTRSRFGRQNMELQRVLYLKQLFVRGENYLMNYLNKALSEDEQQQSVQALLNLADYYLLFGDQVKANHYYQQSWEKLQQLDANHPLRLSLNAPVRLPAFNYSLRNNNDKTRIQPENQASSVTVSLVFDVSLAGTVKNITKPINKSTDESYAQNVKKAVRSIKRSLFRPAFDDGRAVVSQQISYDVNVYNKPNK